VANASAARRFGFDGLIWMGQPKNRSVLFSATGRLSMRRTPSKFTAANRLAQRSSTCSTRKPCAWFVPAMGGFTGGTAFSLIHLSLMTQANTAPVEGAPPCPPDGQGV
jgi:hypothetical protein